MNCPCSSASFLAALNIFFLIPLIVVGIFVALCFVNMCCGKHSFTRFLALSKIDISKLLVLRFSSNMSSNLSRKLLKHSFTSGSSFPGAIRMV